EDCPSYKLFYMYDALGKLAQIKRLRPGASAETFDVLCNSFGDVIALYEGGSLLAKYTYDSWGKLIEITDMLGQDVTDSNDIGQQNSIRYRGYVYDTETSLYYLQSRYYDPETCRFINADNIAYLGAHQAIGEYNLFTYCFNNPVMQSDPDGTLSWNTLCNGASLLSIGVTACLAAATIASGGACLPLLVAATVTFAAGGITVLNGTAEIIESVSDYNYMRDGVYGGDTKYYEVQKQAFAVTAEIGTIVCTAGAASNSACFVAGTVVLTVTGTVAIEDVKVGDLVYATDPDTGETALKEVLQTFVRESSELVHVTVDGEEIICTNEHPFYSPKKGWTAACELRAGDILVTVNGEYVTVEKIQHEILENSIKVYNFEVADFHTYFVAETGILVHNDCRPKSPVKVNENALKNVDVHQLKKDMQVNPISRWDLFKDTANNSRIWLGNKLQTRWIDTGLFLKELINVYPK
ncbi:MAG: hypothetical protein IJ766_05085, partial [Clostridia bacterium]|nr:hypothetical protein [Clostridia bacterium]